MKDMVVFVVENLVLIPPNRGSRLKNVEKRIWSHHYDLRITTEICRIDTETHLGIGLATLMGQNAAEVMEQRFSMENLPGEVLYAESPLQLREYIEGKLVFRAFHNLDNVDLGPLSEQVVDSAIFDPFRS